jgi:glycosyltransferase involved in cell wall biosynthesis
MQSSAEGPVVGISANVVDPWLTGGRVDGIGRYTLALEAGLATLGVVIRRVHAPTRARLLAGIPPPAPAFVLPLPVGVAMGALLRIPMPGAGSVERCVNVYHATDYQVPRLAGTPVVATLYDAIPLTHPEWVNRKLRWLKNRVLRWGARNADRVICISRSIVPEIVEHYGVAEDRIRVIPLGVDARWAEALPAERVLATAARYALRPGFFLFVGTLQPRKNLATALAAYDRLPDFIRRELQFAVVGRYGWGADALRADLLRRRCDGEVVWLDDVDDEALRDLYATAGCFVFPSLGEGFGLPVTEALAAGLPVIASDLPVLREVAGACADYVVADDIDAWVDALVRAPVASITDPRRERRREHALSFSWRSCSEQTLAVYRELF